MNKDCKLVLGDCLEKMKKMPDNSVDLVLTDPPYGIDFQSAWWIERKRFAKIEGDKDISGEWIKEVYRVLKEDGAFYCFTRWDVYPDWLKFFEDFKIKALIVWDRIVHGMGDLNGNYAPCYDLIIFTVKGRHILRHQRPLDIIKHKRVDATKLVHPTEKPIGLLEKLIVNSSDMNQVVFDPFMGSGTTGVAALKLQRKFIGIEINPEYFEIAKKRIGEWENQSRLSWALSRSKGETKK